MKTNQPKRILVLDGGGIRGALTLGFFEHLERIIREKENNEDLLLCDYVDLIMGKSTGAIIAAGLSIGKIAREIKDLFFEHRRENLCAEKFLLEKFQKTIQDFL